MFWRRDVARLQADAGRVAEDWFTVLEHAPQLPEGTKLSGNRMGLTIGTFGSKRGADTLLTHYRDGTINDFGSFGIFEADERMRSMILGRLRGLEDFVVEGGVPERSGGFGNDPPDKVKADVGSWGPAAIRFVDKLIKHHQQRTKGNPTEILIFPSMGGHAYPGVFIAQELHARLPDVPIFAIVNLPANEDHREYFLTLKSEYQAAGVKGFLIGDQMEDQNVTQDSVIGDLLAGFTAASIFSDLSTRFNNIANNVGNLVQFSYAFGNVVARDVSLGKNAPSYYIASREEVKAEARRLVSLIETNKGKVSIAGPISPKRHQTYDLTLLALHPDQVRRIRDEVEGARETEDKQHRGTARPHLHDKGNYHSVFAPWVQPVHPEYPRCQIAVIRLRSLRNDDGDLEELVKFPYKRASQPKPDLLNGKVPQLLTELDDF